MTNLTKEEIDRLDFQEVNEYDTLIWKPENPGDSIKGRYTDKKENVGFNNSTLYEITYGDEVWNVWSGTVIDTCMKKAEIGDYIKLTYLGTQKGKNSSRSYKNYKIAIASTE